MGGDITFVPTAKELFRYQNGNYTVTLYEDGTKTRSNDLTFLSPDFPESIDVKITNMCNLGCAWCHEESVPDGQHCDADILLERLSDLPRGVEIAIGGGNPFTHPDLSYILACLKHFGLVCNITINERHFEQYSYLIQKFIDERLIYGYGISCDRSLTPAAHEIMHEFCPSEGACVVPHLIAGVNVFTDFGKALDIYGKCLILGYKNYGRGAVCYNHEISEEIEVLDYNLSSLFPKGIVSFDNLAIEQLHVKEHLTAPEWNSMYMGDDGSFTMYYDAVKDVFKQSSVAEEEFDFNTATKAFTKGVASSWKK